jgi:hypothetical protein
MIAFEELAELPDGTDAVGHPRRRGFPVHPAAEKKLGHPTLVNGAAARIAGELFLDGKGTSLEWHVSLYSGRYCRDIQPTDAQAEAVLSLFQSMIDANVILDRPEAAA